MAAIAGSIPVTGFIAPTDTLDVFATHTSIYGQGGHHQVETIVDRDAITTERRQWGMLASVYNDGANTGVYQLVYGEVDTDIDNDANWKLLDFGEFHIPLVTETERLALTPDAHDLVIDTTAQDMFIYTGNTWRTFGARGAHFQVDTIPLGETLQVRAGEHAILFGNITIDGTTNVEVGGILDIITGAEREVAIFNADGILDNSIVKIEADGRLNLPVFTAVPATINNGDAYITDIAGTTLLNVKVGGVIKSVELSN